jgi:type II secretory pathway component PulM
LSSKVGLLFTSVGTIVPLFLNPLAWVGAAGGALIGWGICWVVFVLPFQKNLAEREAQLDHWSQLNQQLQQQTMDNRNMSQAELKQFIASNQEATAAYAEIQRRLQQREMHLSETPIYYVIIPVSIVALAFSGVVLLFKAMNQRALMTIEDVVQLAPPELVQAVVARHVALNPPHMPSRTALPSTEMLPAVKVNPPD